MKTIITLILFCICMTAGAQDNTIAVSKAEHFFKAPGKIIAGDEIVKNRYSVGIGNVAYVSLIRFSEFGKNDTVYGLQLSGNVVYGMVDVTPLQRNFTVLLDYRDLEDMISYIKLVKEQQHNKASSDLKFTLNLKDGPLSLHFYHNSLQVQYDRNDVMTLADLGNNAMDKLLDDLSEISKKWPH